MTEPIDLIATPTAHEDELDLIACVLSGADPEPLQLTPDHFDGTQARAAWEAILRVAANGGRPDPTSVRLALGAKGAAASPWLLEVFGRPVVASNATPLAAKVRDTAHRRDLQGLAIRINQACMEGELEPSAIVEMIRTEVDRPVGTIHNTETFGDLLPELIDELQNGVTAGLPTPWTELDEHIHGLGPGQLVIVAARPGVGKSLMAQNLALHWSRRHSKHVYFASIEMRGIELARRAMAQTSKVYLSSLSDPERLTERDWSHIDSASAVLMDDLVHVCADPGQTLESIRSGAREVRRRHGLGLVVVDYLQIVNPRDRRLIREQQVAEVSRGLKLLAKELDVPVVALAQLRRLQEDKPTLNDLRESGSIEQDADAVLMLHIPDNDTPWDAEMLVAKARHGKRGAFSLEMRTHWASIVTPGTDRPTSFKEIS